MGDVKKAERMAAHRLDGPMPGYSDIPEPKRLPVLDSNWVHRPDWETLHLNHRLMPDVYPDPGPPPAGAPWFPFGG